MMNMNAMMKQMPKGGAAAGMGDLGAMMQLAGGMGGAKAKAGMGGAFSQLGDAMQMATDMKKAQSYTTVESILAAFERGEGMATMQLLQLPPEVYLEGLPEICSFLCRFDPRVSVPGRGLLGAVFSGGKGVSMVRHQSVIFFFVYSFSLCNV